jgi:hypothetical protein
MAAGGCDFYNYKPESQSLVTDSLVFSGTKTELGDAFAFIA